LAFFFTRRSQQRPPPAVPSTPSTSGHRPAFSSPQAAPLHIPSPSSAPPQI
jgi:hypothetical protein